MHDLKTIIALNERRDPTEIVSDADLADIIDLWADTKLAESWIDRRIHAMARELQWRRQEMRKTKKG